MSTVVDRVDQKPVDGPASDRFLGIAITPLTRRRLAKFRANKRGILVAVDFSCIISD